MVRGEPTGKSRNRLLPLDGDKTAVGDESLPVRQARHECTSRIGDMLLDVLHHLGINDEMVHLVYAASFLFVLLVLRMLVVQVAILGALLKNHTYPFVVMVVHHYGREQHGESCQPQMEYV